MVCTLLFPIFVVQASLNKTKGASGTKRRKILIVDDDEKLVYVLREMFQAEGYQVRTANNGKLGVRWFLLFEPDLVLTDIEMPEANGFEMMNRIRIYDPRARVIYMTGDVARFRAQLKEEMRAHGARVVSKPFSKKELFRLIGEESQSDRALLP